MQPLPAPTARPVFIIGSPRSGTSILTWCLGQHPNLLPCEESDWIGPFSLQVAAHYAIGSARGERSQLAALGVREEDFLVRIGDAIDHIVVSHRHRLERNSGQVGIADPSQITGGFAISRDRDEPKSRWVDGTPEYAFHVYGLHRMFPGARFVHITRDVDEVVASMLNFRKDDGTPLAATEQRAYAHWLRAARACVRAERALGPDRVHRLRLVDLIEQPRVALTGILEFLEEPFADACLEPLCTRINSTPAEDGSAHTPVAPDQATIRKARELSRLLQQPRDAEVPQPSALQAMHKDFSERVEYARHLDSRYRRARRMLAAALESDDGTVAARMCDLPEMAAPQTPRLRAALNACAVLIGVQLPAALAALIASRRWPGLPAWRIGLGWLSLALVAAAGYMWLRRAGLRQRLQRLFGGAARAVAPAPEQTTTANEETRR